MHRLLYFLLLTYGIFLEPAPKTISIELIIFLLIYTLITLFSLFRLLKPSIVFFIALSLIGLILNIEKLNTQQLFRDLISLSYLFVIPHFFFLNKQKLLKNAKYLEFFLMTAGSFLSIRYINEYPLLYLLNNNIVGDWRNLTSEPLVLASGLLGINWLIRSAKKKLKIIGALVFFISLMGLIAVSFRGPTIILLIYFVSQLFLTFRNKALLYFTAPIILVTLGNLLTPVFEKLLLKQLSVGDNGKLQEISDALYYWIENVFLFGQGLGTDINLGYYGTYTHNFFTYILIRFGLLGTVILTYIYLLPLFKMRKFLYNPTNISLMITLIYISLFQAAYKHLGFAIILGYLLINKNEYSDNNIG